MSKKVDTDAPEPEQEQEPEQQRENGQQSFDLKQLRLPQNFAETVGVKRKLVTLRVRKPHRQEFVRIHPGDDFRLSTALFNQKDESDGTYLVDPQLLEELIAEIVPTLLLLAITRQKVPFIWPLRLPREDGRQDAWSRSALEAASLAEKRWISVRANMSMGAYDVFEAAGELPEPEWPEITFQQAIDLAFRDRYIDSPEHPVIKQLWGRL